MGKLRDACRRLDNATLGLVDKTEKLLEEKEELKNKYLRAEADRENLKKRFEKEKEDLRKFANEELIKELLPVVESLEKSIKFTQTDALIDEGIKMILNSLMKVLKGFGLEEIEPAEGKQFDPDFHQAMYDKEDGSVKPGTVITEFRRGYLLNGRLIRPSLVVISKKVKEKKNE